MARVENGQQATDLVVAFLKQHFAWGARPVSARRDNDIWPVDLLPREAGQNARETE